MGKGVIVIGLLMMLAGGLLGACGKEERVVEHRQLLEAHRLELERARLEGAHTQRIHDERELKALCPGGEVMTLEVVTQ